MAFTFTPCRIEGLWEIQPALFDDARGYTVTSYSEREFFAAGLTMRFVQDNQSASKGGVLRGLHWQTLHPQGKLVRAVVGSIYDVAVDLRNGSKSFGCYHGSLLDATKQNQLYIPPGFAHGFYVLSDYAVCSYKCTDFYHPEDEAGLCWNDSTLAIDWQAMGASVGASGGAAATAFTPLLNEKDSRHPAFDPSRAYFDLNGVWRGGDWRTVAGTVTNARNSSDDSVATNGGGVQ